MGAKQTKMEDNYIPSTVDIRCSSSQTTNINLNVIEDKLDPRSPAVCRTPIILSNRRVDTNAQLIPIKMTEIDNPTDNPLDALRKRIFKGFGNNTNDPRSPSLHLNRTPLVFDDSLDLDDTFADLLIESRAPELVNETKNAEVVDIDVEMPEEQSTDVDASNSEREPLPETPIALQQQFDPRSPSIGVERTPILFNDDDDSNEDVILENILATLTLNLNASSTSSIVSLTSPNAKSDSTERNEKQVLCKPTNKHLDRVRIGKKAISKGPQRKSNRRLSRQQIYEDLENRMPSTPKLKVFQTDNDSPKGKRTPLSCVRNRNSTQVRSRSVESSIKSIQKRIPLTSFDDSLNPTDNHNVLSLSIKQQDSLDL